MKLLIYQFVFFFWCSLILAVSHLINDFHPAKKMHYGFKILEVALFGLLLLLLLQTIGVSCQRTSGRPLVESLELSSAYSRDVLVDVIPYYRLNHLNTIARARNLEMDATRYAAGDLRSESTGNSLFGFTFAHENLRRVFVHQVVSSTAFKMTSRNPNAVEALHLGYIKAALIHHHKPGSHSAVDICDDVIPQAYLVVAASNSTDALVEWTVRAHPSVKVASSYPNNVTVLESFLGLASEGQTAIDLACVVIDPTFTEDYIGAYIRLDPNSSIWARHLDFRTKKTEASNDNNNAQNGYFTNRHSVIRISRKSQHLQPFTRMGTRSDNGPCSRIDALSGKDKAGTIYMPVNYELREKSTLISGNQQQNNNNRVQLSNSLPLSRSQLDAWDMIGINPFEFSNPDTRDEGVVDHSLLDTNHTEDHSLKKLLSSDATQANYVGLELGRSTLAQHAAGITYVATENSPYFEVVWERNGPSVQLEIWAGIILFILFILTVGRMIPSTSYEMTAPSDPAHDIIKGSAENSSPIEPEIVNTNFVDQYYELVHSKDGVSHIHLNQPLFRVDTSQFVVDPLIGALYIASFIVTAVKGNLIGPTPSVMPGFELIVSTTVPAFFYALSIWIFTFGTFVFAKSAYRAYKQQRVNENVSFFRVYIAWILIDTMIGTFVAQIKPDIFDVAAYTKHKRSTRAGTDSRTPLVSKPSIVQPGFVEQVTRSSIEPAYDYIFSHIIIQVHGFILSFVSISVVLGWDRSRLFNFGFIAAASVALGSYILYVTIAYTFTVFVARARKATVGWVAYLTLFYVAALCVSIVIISQTYIIIPLVQSAGATVYSDLTLTYITWTGWGVIACVWVKQIADAYIE